MGKGETAQNEQFLLFPQCFLLNQIIVSPLNLSTFLTSYLYLLLNWESLKLGYQVKGSQLGIILAKMPRRHGLLSWWWTCDPRLKQIHVSSVMTDMSKVKVCRANINTVTPGTWYVKGYSLSGQHQHCDTWDMICQRLQFVGPTSTLWHLGHDMSKVTVCRVNINTVTPGTWYVKGYSLSGQHQHCDTWDMICQRLQFVGPTSTLWHLGHDMSKVTVCRANINTVTPGTWYVKGYSLSGQHQHCDTWDKICQRLQFVGPKSTLWHLGHDMSKVTVCQVNINTVTPGTWQYLEFLFQESWHKTPQVRFLWKMTAFFHIPVYHFPASLLCHHL